jgi:hypothetical protein
MADRHVHRHAQSRSRAALAARDASTRCYTGPVRQPESLGYEPRAHGNVCHVETCHCGARRTVNVNAGCREYGTWVP